MLGDDGEGGVSWKKRLVEVGASAKGGHGSVAWGVNHDEVARSVVLHTSLRRIASGSIRDSRLSPPTHANCGPCERSTMMIKLYCS